MAVKSIGNSKAFTSATEGRENNHQTRNKKDEELRDYLIKNFAFSDDERKINRGLVFFPFNYKAYTGFDGKILYSFVIIDDLDSKKQGSKKVEYHTKILIKKAEDKDQLEFFSDLEKFLHAKSFKELK